MYLPAWDTLPETNIASENWPFQKESSLPTIFRCYVSFREGSHKSFWKKNTSTWPLLPFANVRLRQLPCKGRWPSPLVGEKNPTSWPRLVTPFFSNKKNLGKLQCLNWPDWVSNNFDILCLGAGEKNNNTWEGTTTTLEGRIARYSEIVAIKT